ncbi:MAG: alkaline phosphatase [Leadbetterella sp.]|nr:alkaline phosphatase [Leadbetterella sp.]
MGLISQSFRNYSLWNGKGVPVEKERQAFSKVVEKAHSQQKPLRFWATPDFSNAWKVLMNMGVDYINTDKVQELGQYLRRRKSDEFQNTDFHEVYLPAYRNNDTYGRVKNIILLIGDGMGLAQIQAGLTANKGLLNLSRFRNIGFSTTEATDNYITDSAAGGTAMATGKKTHNRGIAVDSADVAVESMATTFRKRGMKTAIISSGDITDATPAVFYAHRPERSMSREIARDFLHQPSDILIGGGEKWFLETGVAEELKEKRVRLFNRVV